MNFHPLNRWTIQFFFCVISLLGSAQAKDKSLPLVLGRGEERFTIGALLHKDDFKNLDQWIVQIEASKKLPKEKIKTHNNTLDCFLPSRGCTIWFKEKLKTRITITYDVICPVTEPDISGIMPKDINNFWLASDRLDTKKGLFDTSRYTGSFSSYDKMQGYYASTGGSKNTTTRMRRYPREIDGKPVRHIALKDKDRQKKFLISPEKLIKIQLVAYDDLIQYIVDGRLVYEIVAGDKVEIEQPNAKKKRASGESLYDLDSFPIHTEGYFGFRMVGTHHIYSKFRIYTLKPVKKKGEHPKPL